MAPASQGQRYLTHIATPDKAQKTCQALIVRRRGRPAPDPAVLRCASRRGLAPLRLRAPCHFDTIRGSGQSVLLSTATHGAVTGPPAESRCRKGCVNFRAVGVGLAIWITQPWVMQQPSCLSAGQIDPDGGTGVGGERGLGCDATAVGTRHGTRRTGGRVRMDWLVTSDKKTNSSFLTKRSPPTGDSSRRAGDMNRPQGRGPDRHGHGAPGAAGVKRARHQPREIAPRRGRSS
jgi:hypothetical protein